MVQQFYGDDHVAIQVTPRHLQIRLLDYHFPTDACCERIFTMPTVLPDLTQAVQSLQDHHI